MFCLFWYYCCIWIQPGKILYLVGYSKINEIKEAKVMTKHLKNKLKWASAEFKSAVNIQNIK